ncbi:copper resistance protein CopC, partial [Shigella sonnei]|nr:copper resistance protein CopC [Shigella sonnei]
TVDWHVVSVDGHKTKGHYTFSMIYFTLKV